MGTVCCRRRSTVKVKVSQVGPSDGGWPVPLLCLCICSVPIAALAALVALAVAVVVADAFTSLTAHLSSFPLSSTLPSSYNTPHPTAPPGVTTVLTTHTRRTMRWSLLLGALAIAARVLAREGRDIERPLPLPPEVLSRSLPVSIPSPHAATLRRQSRRANTTTTTTASTSSSSSSSSNASASLPLRPSTAPAAPPSPVPSPLDTSISYALSDSCLLYLTSLLQATTFQSCLPFSLLLSTSSSYAQLVSAATGTNNYTTLNELLAYTYSPQPSGDQCDTYMQGVLSDMGGKSNCQADIAAKKVVALEAKIGVGTYAVVRQAENLIDPDTGVYCYLEALASDRPDDLYLWSLPQGIA